MKNIKKLKLKRPLSFVDIETTGLSIENDRIIEITICKVFPDGTKELKTRRFNPEMKISAEATAIHGITDEMVAKEKPFKKSAKGLVAFLSDSDLAGYVSNKFDFPMLNEEFKRSEVEWDYKKSNLIDVYNILAIQEPRTLAGAYKHYLGKELGGIHASEVDILATVEIFDQQLAKYPEIATTIEDISFMSNYSRKSLDIGGKFYANAEGIVYFGFGKNNDKPAQSDLSYLEFMISEKSTFPHEVQIIAKEQLNLAKENAKLKK